MEVNKYLKNVEPLVAEFNRLTDAVTQAQAMMEEALAWNQSIEGKYEALRVAGFSDSAIAAALVMELGPAPVAPRPRAPRTPREPRSPEPTPDELKLLGVMTSEGMTSTQIYKAANHEGETVGVMSEMASMGWVENASGKKGRGALWTLTPKGFEQL